MRILSFGLLSCLILLTPADAARGGPAEPVLEVVTFRLMPGVSGAEFLAAAQATKPALAGQPGFIRRRLLYDADGVWTDLIEWQSLTEAQAAAERVMQMPEFGPFMAAIDPSSIEMAHRAVVWQMD